MDYQLEYDFENFVDFKDFINNKLKLYFGYNFTISDFGYLDTYPDSIRFFIQCDSPHFIKDSHTIERLNQFFSRTFGKIGDKLELGFDQVEVGFSTFEDLDIKSVFLKLRFFVITDSVFKKIFCCRDRCFVTPTCQVDGLACKACGAFSFCHCRCINWVKKDISFDS